MDPEQLEFRGLNGIEQQQRGRVQLALSGCTLEAQLHTCHTLLAAVSQRGLWAQRKQEIELGFRRPGTSKADKCFSGPRSSLEFDRLVFMP